MDLKLTGKTALVTGSTAGIGLEIARRLAVEGASVIVTGRSEKKLDEAVNSIRASGGKQVSGVVADAGTAEGAKTVLAAAGQVDILVNNLGIYEAKSFTDITDEDWLSMFEVNVLSGVRLARGLMPGMIERNWGRIIFISSESGLNTPAEMVHYGTTKTAQLAVSRGLANLAKGTGVTVNSVLPGPTRAEAIVEFLRSALNMPTASEAELEAEFFKKGRPTSLIQRMLNPEEIADLVAFVASPLSSGTTGAALRVEGGIVQTIA
jgi:NAD(P)-dependent dehydrogenase (short-subunit alcohol dehydrogenase family)